MTIELLIDQIDRAHMLETGRKLPVDRMVIQDLVEQSLSSLASQDEFDFLKQALEPLIQTKPSLREYPLPENFPQNFLRFSNPDTGEQSWSCKIDDGSSAQTMRYESPEAFYRRDLSAEPTGQPFAYTIIGMPSGGKQLVVAPPPNTTSYTISGVFMPSEFNLNRDSLPAAPAELLRLDVLRQLAPGNQNFLTGWRSALSDLYMSQARVSDASFTPGAN